MRILFLIACAISAGCATPVYNYVPEATHISEPPIGEIAEKSIGEPLLRQGYYTVSEAVQVKGRYVKQSNIIEPGWFIKTGEDEKYTHYRFNSAADGGKVTKRLLGDPPKSVAIRNETGEFCTITIYNYSMCHSDIDYEIGSYHVAKASSFQQALLYNGINDNTISIAYRETSGDYARPAFNNDVQYDLSKSKTIAYKGAMIEIIEADNIKIKYKVLKNFN